MFFPAIIQSPGKLNINPMKTLYFILLALLIFIGEIMAQESEMPQTVISIRDLYTLQVPNIDIEKSTVLDTAVLNVTYRFHYQIDENAPKKSAWMTLSVGKSFVKFSSDDYFRRDSMFTYNFKKLVPSYSCDGIPCEELLYQKESRHTTAFNRMPGGNAELIIYEEKVPPINWIVSDTLSCTISGYRCHYAEGMFGGRQWKVWFAPDIPVAYGPWKLAGLPGVILSAEESNGSYRFECIKISSQAKYISWYDCQYRNMQKLEWRKLNKRVHNAPLAQITKDKEIMYAYKMRKLDDTWTIPYNPIELE